MGNNLSDYLYNRDNDPNHIFSSLNSQELAELNETSTIQAIRKGQYIFEESEEPRGLIYLTKGSAKVFKVGAGDREQIVRLVKPFSFVGYKALFAEKAHTTSSAAMEDSEITIYNKNTLYRIIENNSSFAKEIIKALANELGFNYNRIINLTQKHIRGRLAEALLLIRDMYGFTPDGKTLNAHFTRDTIAHFSNMTTSNAIRTLKHFEKEGLIRTQHKAIQLLQIERLVEISKFG